MGSSLKLFSQKISFIDNLHGSIYVSVILPHIDVVFVSRTSVSSIIWVLLLTKKSWQPSFQSYNLFLMNLTKRKKSCFSWFVRVSLLSSLENLDSKKWWLQPTLCSKDRFRIYNRDLTKIQRRKKNCWCQQNMHIVRPPCFRRDEVAKSFHLRFLKAVFLKFDLVHSWILCLIREYLNTLSHTFSPPLC